MEIVKQFAAQGARAPCYFYRTVHDMEIDLVIDYGQYLNAFELKFSATPTQNMTQSLAHFKKEDPKKIPFSNGIATEHWSRIVLDPKYLKEG